MPKERYTVKMGVEAGFFSLKPARERKRLCKSLLFLDTFFSDKKKYQYN